MVKLIKEYALTTEIQQFHFSALKNRCASEHWSTKVMEAKVKLMFLKVRLPIPRIAHKHTPTGKSVLWLDIRSFICSFNSKILPLIMREFIGHKWQNTLGLHWPGWSLPEWFSVTWWCCPAGPDQRAGSAPAWPPRPAAGSGPTWCGSVHPPDSGGRSPESGSDSAGTRSGGRKQEKKGKLFRELFLSNLGFLRGRKVKPMWKWQKKKCSSSNGH